MAIKIVRKPSLFLVHCDECGTKFTCERDDLKKGYRCFGAYDEWEVQYVKCPTCGEDIDVYVEGKLDSDVEVILQPEKK